MAETRVSLAIIRQALADMQLVGVTEAAARAGVHPKTLYRWRDARQRNGAQWPTDHDIEAWEQQNDQLAEARRHKAKRLASYRKRRYLNSGRPLMVSSLGTRRRIRALMALGWRAADISASCGWSTAEAVTILMTRNLVKPETRVRIDLVYEQLCMRLGPSNDNRRRALAAGWPPPLAWDDIDDPAERPSGWRYKPMKYRHRDVDEAVVIRALRGEVVEHTTKAERDEIARRWAESGRSLTKLAELTGWRTDRYHHIGAA